MKRKHKIEGHETPENMFRATPSPRNPESVFGIFDSPGHMTMDASQSASSQLEPPSGSSMPTPSTPLYSSSVPVMRCHTRTPSSGVSAGSSPAPSRPGIPLRQTTALRITRRIEHPYSLNMLDMSLSNYPSEMPQTADASLAYVDLPLPVPPLPRSRSRGLEPITLEFASLELEPSESRMLDVDWHASSGLGSNVHEPVFGQSVPSLATPPPVDGSRGDYCTYPAGWPATGWS
jgi:hypothetical protein